MSKTKHTPGPWLVQATGDSFVVETHTHTEVISVDENGDTCRWSEYNEATARLIAASPMLLEALQEIVAAADGAGWSQLDATLAKARAAIAKATGGAA